ncbi:MAG: lysophospholipid acyltransferase family protein [Paludibacteraceae bacterium]|nr:lysophospholipid acyltransferase family protein [Paludibacteraceae bacterium]
MLTHFVSLLSRLPLSVLHALADGVVYPLMYYVVRYRRRLVRKNLALSFPEKSSQERKAIERAFYHQFCYTMMESVYGYRCADEEMRRRVVFGNMDEVNRLVDAAGGGIFMLAHMANWEWMASIQQWVSPGVTELNVYRRLKSDAMDKLMLAIRAKRGGACVEKQRILREMVRYRSEKKPVTIGLLSDQKPRPEVVRTWTTFLNQDTGWLDGGEVLSRKFGYPVFYLYITRTKKGYYNADMRVIAADPRATEEGEITKAYAAILEQNIKEQPELWLWSHNRWKWHRKD